MNSDLLRGHHRKQCQLARGAGQSDDWYETRILFLIYVVVFVLHFLFGVLFFLSAGVCLSGYGGQPSRVCNPVTSNDAVFGVIANPCIKRMVFSLS